MTFVITLVKVLFLLMMLFMITLDLLFFFILFLITLVLILFLMMMMMFMIALVMGFFFIMMFMIVLILVIFFLMSLFCDHLGPGHFPHHDNACDHLGLIPLVHHNVVHDRPVFVLFLILMLFAITLVLRVKAMEDLIVHLKEAIYLSEPQLEVDQCGCASISNAIVSTTSTKKFTTKDVTQPWALLANQRYFWKTKTVLLHLGFYLHLLRHLHKK